MNTPLSANPAVPAAKSAGLPSLEARKAAVEAELDAATVDRGLTPGDDAATADAATDAAIAAKTPKADPTEVNTQGVVETPAVDEAKERAAARRARLEAAQHKTREQVDRKAQQAAADKLARDLAAATARADAAEKAAASRVDLQGIDEATFFKLAEDNKVSPQKLSEWLAAGGSAEKLAARDILQQTQQTYDPKLTALEEKIARQEERIAAYEKHAEEQRETAAEQRAQAQFKHTVSQSAERAPLAARLLAHDADEFMEMAMVAAQQVPGQGEEALLDAIEEMLDGPARQVAQKYAAIYTPAEPSQPSAPTTPTTRGAAKPNTVSNSLAQGRTALVEGQDWAALSLEERAARLKR